MPVAIVANAVTIEEILNALPAGTNNIGDVDVLTLPPLPAGTNNIGDVDVLTLPPIPAGTNNIGDVDVLTLPPLPAGTNNIGDVDVLTLPNVTLASQASPFTDDVKVTLDSEQVDISDRAARDLGKVDIAAFDVALPAGTNNIGDVDVLTLPPLPAGTNNIGDVDVLTLPSLPAGTNNIGDVDVLTLPSLPAGTNNIGDVDVLTLPNVTLASQASPFTDDLKITLDSEQVDISDRAARDMGKIDIAGFDVSLPAGSNSIGKVKAELQDNAGTGITSTLVTGKQSLDVNVTQQVSPASNAEATFTVVSFTTVIGNNKSMISIFNDNTATKVLKLKRIFLRNPRTTAITGVTTDFRLIRITGHSGGTLLTPNTHDTADTLSSAVTVRTGSTVSGESANHLDRWVWSSDEWGTGTLDQEGLEHSFMNLFSLYDSVPDPSTKNIRLRVSEGLTLKCVTNSTAGEFDIIMVFTEV